jgi:hypothetical protein
MFWSCPSVLKTIPPLFFCLFVNLPHTPFLSKDLLHFHLLQKPSFIFQLSKQTSLVIFSLVPLSSLVSKTIFLSFFSLFSFVRSSLSFCFFFDLFSIIFPKSPLAPLSVLVLIGKKGGSYYPCPVMAQG